MLSSTSSSLAVFSTPNPPPFSLSVTPSAALVTSKELVREPQGGDMVTGNDLGPEVGEPPGDGNVGDPTAIGNVLASVVGELPGDGNEGTPLVTGIEPGSVVGEPPGDGNEGDPLVIDNELGSVVAEPPGGGNEGDPMVTGSEPGPEVGEPPGGGKKGTFFFPDIGHDTATSAASGWRNDSGA